MLTPPADAAGLRASDRVGVPRDRAMVWLDGATRSPARAAAWLTLIALALFLPGFFTMPPMDRDEPRFAQASKQMLETRDFVAIRFQNEARNKKPVGIYWLQAGSVAALEAIGLSDARRRIWAYRLPSLAGAVAAVLLTFWAALAVTSRRYAFLAALLFAATTLIGVEARLAKTDAILTATAAASLGVFLRAYLAAGAATAGRLLPPALAGLFWAAIAAGVLVKGPIGPMIPLLAGAVLVWRDRRTPAVARHWIASLRPARGLLLSLLLVAPWFVLILLRTHGAFLSDSVGRDMLGKVAGAQESHGAPPGSYLLAFFVSGWPLAPLGVLVAPVVWRCRREPVITVLLAWIVPSWLLFELVPTKLPHYVLPLYPAIAVLVACCLQNGEAAWRPLVRRIAAVLLFFVPVAAMAAALVIGGREGVRLGGLFAALACLVVGLASATAYALWRSGDRDGPTRTFGLVFAVAALAFLLEATVYQALLSGPFFAPFALSDRLVEASGAVRRDAPGCPALALATTSYREPSLVFLTGTGLLMTNPSGAAGFLDGGPCRAAFVPVRDEAAFLAALSTGSGVRLASRVRGFDFNGGKTLDIGVYARRDAGS